MKHSEINWPQFIDFLKQQVGKPYVFGVENDPNEKDWAKYKAWDCSELFQVAFHKIGISIPDGSYNQAKVCRKIPGHWADFPGKLLLGDLGFKHNPETGVIHHVGTFVGGSQVIEAKGLKWGVVQTPIDSYMASSHFAWWGRLRIVEDA